MLTDGQSPEAIINTVFLRLKERSSSYSMRKFAKNLQISVTLLSFVMSGRRTASATIVRNLLLSNHLLTKERFTLIQWLTTNAQSKGSLGQKCRETFEELSLDRFALISSPEHYDVLTYLGMERGKRSIIGISRDLKLEPNVVTAVLDRLCRLKLVRLKDGRYVPAQTSVTTTDNVPSVAIRSFHRAKLERFIGNLDGIPVESRDFSCVSMVIGSHKFQAFREEVASFRRYMFEKYNDQKSGDRVLDLAFQIQPVSRALPIESQQQSI